MWSWKDEADPCQERVFGGGLAAFATLVFAGLLPRHLISAFRSANLFKAASDVETNGIADMAFLLISSKASRLPESAFLI